jgi:hypothetical protein
MMLVTMWMALLWDGARGRGVSVAVVSGSGSGALLGLEGFKLRKKSPPARLHVSASDKYDASLCIWRYISLEMYYLMVAYGCVAA